MISTMSWKYWAIFSAIFASLTAIFGKVGVQNINSNLAVWFRAIIIMGLLSLYIYFKKLPLVPLVNDKRTLFFLILSAISTCASWVCYYKALQEGPASKVALIDKLSVVFTVMFAILFLQETVTLKVILGALLIFIGSLILLL